jgi:hypothetical protein
MKTIITFLCLFIIGTVSAQRKPIAALVVLDSIPLVEPQLRELALNVLDPEKIKSIKVFTGAEATDKYGDLAKEGVIIIAFKPSKKKAFDKKSEKIYHPLYILDSVPLFDFKVKKVILENIDRHRVKKIEKLETKAAAKYGDAAKNGVINITLKPQKAKKQKSKDKETIFIR